MKACIIRFNINLYFYDMCYRILSLIAFCVCSGSLYTQEDIHIVNGSFEGIARRGALFFKLDGWMGCEVYPGETPPDILSGDSEIWEVNHPPHSGTTYIGLVRRDNDTRESITQRLSGRMKRGMIYRSSIWLSQSERYISASRSYNNRIYNYDNPSYLRIYAGNEFCEKRQLLWESPIIDEREWKEYSFEFVSVEDYKYITLEVESIEDEEEGINGHILLDDMSDIKCGGPFHPFMLSNMPAYLNFLYHYDFQSEDDPHITFISQNKLLLDSLLGKGNLDNKTLRLVMKSVEEVKDLKELNLNRYDLQESDSLKTLLLINYYLLVDENEDKRMQIITDFFNTYTQVEWTVAKDLLLDLIIHNEDQKMLDWIDFYMKRYIGKVKTYDFMDLESCLLYKKGEKDTAIKMVREMNKMAFASGHKMRPSILLLREKSKLRNEK